MSDERKALREEILQDARKRYPPQPAPARTSEQALRQQTEAQVRRRDEAAKPVGDAS